MMQKFFNKNYTVNMQTGTFMSRNSKYLNNGDVQSNNQKRIGKSIRGKLNQH